MQKWKVLDFNHISKDLSNDRKQELMALYKYYHKQRSIHKAMYQHFKRLNLVLSV